MPCHRSVVSENGNITYRCRQCVRPRLPERRGGILRMHHECLCSTHFASQHSGGIDIDD